MKRKILRSVIAALLIVVLSVPQVASAATITITSTETGETGNVPAATDFIMRAYGVMLTMREVG